MVPVIRRCQVAHVGRVRTNPAIDPAATMISALTVMLTAICTLPRAKALEDHVAAGGFDELWDQR